MMFSTTERMKWGVTNLRLAFPEQPQMHFHDLNFQYQAGERVLLLGPSGCGKSTLLQVLSGLIPNSVPIAMKAEKQSIPGKWGFIFQDPDTQFCMPYADEDIAFVLENKRMKREKMPERIRHYLQLTGLDFADPHYLIHRMSGGMKQRLAIASVLALEPDVLFLDEPTALLDPEGTRQFWNTVQRVGHDRTLIIVEHKIERVIDLVDRIVLFNAEGKIIADGPKNELLKRHKQDLIRDGIWYPGAWADHFQTAAARTAVAGQQLLLTLDHLAVKRDGEKKVFVEHLEIHQGEWVAIIGVNGAGKSTLLEGMKGLLRRKGECRWNLQNPDEEIGFVFQNPEYQFVTDSVEDEIAIGLHLKKIDGQLIRERVDELLKAFSLERFRKRHPFQLSVGQKRRLSVATALAVPPKVLMLDEPTFGQDAKNTFSLLHLLSDLQKRGTTIFMVTHEMKIVRRFASRILVIDEGKLVADRVGEADRV